MPGQRPAPLATGGLRTEPGTGATPVGVTPGLAVEPFTWTPSGGWKPTKAPPSRSASAESPRSGLALALEEEAAVEAELVRTQSQIAEGKRQLAELVERSTVGSPRGRSPRSDATAAAAVPVVRGKLQRKRTGSAGSTGSTGSIQVEQSPQPPLDAGPPPPTDVTIAVEAEKFALRVRWWERDAATFELKDRSNTIRLKPRVFDKADVPTVAARIAQKCTSVQNSLPLLEEKLHTLRLLAQNMAQKPAEPAAPASKPKQRPKLQYTGSSSWSSPRPRPAPQPAPQPEPQPAAAELGRMPSRGLEPLTWTPSSGWNPLDRISRARAEEAHYKQAEAEADAELVKTRSKIAEEEAALLATQGSAELSHQASITSMPLAQRQRLLAKGALGR